MRAAATRPRIAITMGDPAGVGAEIIASAWRSPELFSWCRPVVLGHPVILRRAIELLGTRCAVVDVHEVPRAEPSPGAIPCLRVMADEAAETPPGQVDARGGRAAFDALQEAARLALSGDVDAIVTAPLNKESLWKAGYRYPGHTEMLAELCGTAEFAMLLYLPPGAPLANPQGLGVVHVTLHRALRDVFSQVTEDNIVGKARLLHAFLSQWTRGPRIGVAALNPHAGEAGLFGGEERDVIAPAVARARQEGIAAEGPFPADTLMVRGRDGEFDGIVAMYHDQGHIALKLLGMYRAVNVTLGLPIVRTSVAHGTAFDLAWQGRAQSAGMREALRMAARLARERQGSQAAP